MTNYFLTRVYYVEILGHLLNPFLNLVTSELFCISPVYVPVWAQNWFLLPVGSVWILPTTQFLFYKKFYFSSLSIFFPLVTQILLRTNGILTQSIDNHKLKPSEPIGSRVGRGFRRFQAGCRTAYPPACGDSFVRVSSPNNQKSRSTVTNLKKTDNDIIIVYYNYYY